jgi:thiamine-phosphate pyrophosphorylase
MSFPLYCITNRHLYDRPLPEALEPILQQRPAGLILREKDLTEGEYRDLAKKVLELCRRYGVPCWLHTFVDVARSCSRRDSTCRFLYCGGWGADDRKGLPKQIGASCHSLEDIREAAKLGATCCTFSPVYPSQCKPGVPPKGLALLHRVCQHSPIPVYALGGVKPDKADELAAAGAAGGVMMSGWIR